MRDSGCIAVIGVKVVGTFAGHVAGTGYDAGVGCGASHLFPVASRRTALDGRVGSSRYRSLRKRPCWLRRQQCQEKVISTHCSERLRTGRMIFDPTYPSVEMSDFSNCDSKNSMGMSRRQSRWMHQSRRERKLIFASMSTLTVQERKGRDDRVEDATIV